MVWWNTTNNETGGSSDDALVLLAAELRRDDFQPSKTFGASGESVTNLLSGEFYLIRRCAESGNRPCSTQRIRGFDDEVSAVASRICC